MLSREENELLTQVGRGTPMGDLLRRYWYPIAASAGVSRETHEGGAGARRRLGALSRQSRGGPGSSARSARTGACRWFWAFPEKTACAVRTMAGSTTEAENVSSNPMSRPKTRQHV